QSNGCCSVKEDIRPGLIHNRTQQRTHDIERKKKVTDEDNKQQNRPQRLIEAERREEGLNEAIADSNRGFALLQKMGYKPGMAIGKSGTGYVEPVRIVLKSDRSGLGRDAELKEIAAQKLAIRKRLMHKREKATDTQDYRARITRKAAERQIEGDLRKSQRVCEELDTSKGFDEPAEPWFWSPRKTQAADDKEDEDEPKNQQDINREKEKLEILTLYLRRTHFYCIWCGVQFEDEKDLQDSCPGPSRDDH
ncbi:Coiled-coil domain-containing protein 75, partial [Zootermopsis nevadensis]